MVPVDLQHVPLQQTILVGEYFPDHQYININRVVFTRSISCTDSEVNYRATTIDKALYIKLYKLAINLKTRFFHSCYSKIYG